MQGMEATHIAIQEPPLVLWDWKNDSKQSRTVELIQTVYMYLICSHNTTYSVPVQCVVILATCMYYFDHEKTQDLLFIIASSLYF